VRVFVTSLAWIVLASTTPTAVSAQAPLVDFNCSQPTSLHFGFTIDTANGVSIRAQAESQRAMLAARFDADSLMRWLDGADSILAKPPDPKAPLGSTHALNSQTATLRLMRESCSGHTRFLVALASNRNAALHSVALNDSAAHTLLTDATKLVASARELSTAKPNGDGICGLTCPPPTACSAAAPCARHAIERSAKPRKIERPPKVKDAHGEYVRGGVAMSFIVDTLGMVEPNSIDFLEVDAPELRDPAAATIKKWLFHPAEDDGHKVREHVLVPVYFDPDR
jgi:hypothetical protein